MICLTACQASKGTTIDLNTRRRAALKWTYPGWEITHLRGSDRWHAQRNTLVTDAQHDAGIIAGFICDTYDEFVAQLAEQQALVDRYGPGQPP